MIITKIHPTKIHSTIYLQRKKYFLKNALGGTIFGSPKVGFDLQRHRAPNFMAISWPVVPLPRMLARGKWNVILVVTIAYWEGGTAQYRKINFREILQTFTINLASTSLIPLKKWVRPIEWPQKQGKTNKETHQPPTLKPHLFIGS